MTRLTEVPSWELLETMTLSRLQASMPVGLPLGFRTDALYDGEIGRLLGALTAMVMPERYGLQNLSRQLTLTDAQEDYIDVVGRSYGLPIRRPSEIPDEYVARVSERLLTKGRTIPNIQANLEKMGYRAKLYPAAGSLFVPSAAGRSPSSRRCCLPNALIKAGTYFVELWGPTMSNWGVHELLESQTDAANAYVLLHHAHFRLVDVCNGEARVAGRTKRTRKQLVCYRSQRSLVPSAPWASPGGSGALPGGPNWVRLTRRKRRQWTAPEADLLTFTPLPLAQQLNYFVALDRTDPWAAPGKLRYTVESEPLTVSSTRSCLQAGVRRTKRS